MSTASTACPTGCPWIRPLEWANPGLARRTGARSSRYALARCPPPKTRADGLPEAWSTPTDLYIAVDCLRSPIPTRNEQEAAHLWYHDPRSRHHAAQRLHGGLPASISFRDANEDKLRATNVLPSYPYEIPIMLGDRMFDENGAALLSVTGPSDPRGCPIRPICPNSSVM